MKKNLFLKVIAEEYGPGKAEEIAPKLPEEVNPTEAIALLDTMLEVNVQRVFREFGRAGERVVTKGKLSLPM